MSKTTVVYIWPNWEFYLARAVAPEATYLAAEPGDTCESILHRLTPDCECFWFHLDATITTKFPSERPALLAALSKRGIQALNGEVLDISKRCLHKFSREHGFVDVSAAEAGDPDELIIVKTDYNSRGSTERELTESDQALLGLPHDSAAPVDFQYHVGPRSSIDPSAWKNPALVCERFIRNDYGIWYRAFIRRPKMFVAQFRAAAPIKKDAKSVLLEITRLRTDDNSTMSNKIASMILRFADAFRLDFGALDIVTDLNGVAAVVDVNPTPWNGQRAALFQHLVDVTAYFKE